MSAAYTGIARDSIKPALDVITASVTRQLLNLPVSNQITVLRAVAHAHSWSYGADKLFEAADEIAADLAEQERDAHPDPYFSGVYGQGGTV